MQGDKRETRFFRLFTFVSIPIALLGHVAAAEDSDETDVKAELVQTAGDVVFCETSKLNIGNVNIGERKKVDFTLRNLTHVDINVARVRTTCGCTRPEIPASVLHPGESAKCHVVILPTKVTSNSYKAIEITGTEKDDPKVVIPIVIQVMRPFTVIKRIVRGTDVGEWVQIGLVSLQSDDVLGELKLVGPSGFITRVVSTKNPGEFGIQFKGHRDQTVKFGLLFGRDESRGSVYEEPFWFQPGMKTWRVFPKRLMVGTDAQLFLLSSGDQGSEAEFAFLSDAGELLGLEVQKVSERSYLVPVKSELSKQCKSITVKVNGNEVGKAVIVPR